MPTGSRSTCDLWAWAMRGGWASFPAVGLASFRAGDWASFPAGGWACQRVQGMGARQPGPWSRCCPAQPGRPLWRLRALGPRRAALRVSQRGRRRDGPGGFPPRGELLGGRLRGASFRPRTEPPECVAGQPRSPAVGLLPGARQEEFSHRTLAHQTHSR